MIRTKDDAIAYINARVNSNWETIIDAGEENSNTFYKVNQGGARILKNGITVSKFSDLVNYVYKNRKHFN